MASTLSLAFFPLAAYWIATIFLRSSRCTLQRTEVLIRPPTLRYIHPVHPLHLQRPPRRRPLNRHQHAQGAAAAAALFLGRLALFELLPPEDTCDGAT